MYHSRDIELWEDSDMVYQKIFKRMLDCILAFVAIILASWLFLILSLLIKLESKGPIFFKQKRIGKNLTQFNIIKFRTMRVDTPKDVPTHLLDHPEQYITKIGKFLRKTSLDELPQLFNILLGQMAIVGPRPALYNQDDLVALRSLYGANDVRPGLTGLAQINGRDELPIEEKASLDGKYVNHITIAEDIRIIFQTVFAVVKQNGIKEGTQEGKAAHILFLEPIMKEVLWGGSRLRDDFHYPIKSDHTGECWAVSAHPFGDCKVVRGCYTGVTLSNLWETRRDLFGNRTEKKFPLLIKIIDAKKDLSIQVHPNDQYANEHENGESGKTECWYILDCEKDASIIIGHNAKDQKEVKHMIHSGEWDKFLRSVPIKKGDFFQIDPGTVHAIKAGTLLLETQQNSDITYRVYDYDRIVEGKKRELHVEKSIEVITAPYIEKSQKREIIEEEKDYRVERLITCSYYTVEKLDISGIVTRKQDKDFRIVSVIDGEGEIEGVPIAKGSHFIIPFGFGEYTIKGRLELISSYLA